MALSYQLVSIVFEQYDEMDDDTDVVIDFDYTQYYNTEPQASAIFVPTEESRRTINLDDLTPYSGNLMEYFVRYIVTYKVIGSDVKLYKRELLIDDDEEADVPYPYLD